MWLGEFTHFYDVLTDVGHEVTLDDYAGIYLIGGHGTMFDFSNDEVKKAVAYFADNDKIVSAVCHGPCGLLDVTLANGSKLLDDRTVTGYSWTEEKLANRTDEVPFSLEDKLREQAGEYTTAKIPMTKHVVVDGNLITGQNPMSAAGVGEAVLKVVG